MKGLRSGGHMPAGFLWFDGSGSCDFPSRGKLRNDVVARPSGQVVLPSDIDRQASTQQFHRPRTGHTTPHIVLTADKTILPVLVVQFDLIDFFIAKNKTDRNDELGLVVAANRVDIAPQQDRLAKQMVDRKI